ncbi:MAG TPA: glycosyltransferase family A protein [Rhodothermales bacterium]|nr:glycosyltransferase family A protein [Rhodothermales bacterium]
MIRRLNPLQVLELTWRKAFTGFENAEDLLLVVLPAYNAAATLERAMRSVFAQTHQNWILVVIDDGSEDETYDVAVHTGAGRANVHVLRLDENVGSFRAFNAGLRRFWSEDWRWYIAQGADDESHPTRFEKLLQVAAVSPDPDFVTSRYRRIDPAKGGEIVGVRYGEGTAMISRRAFEALGFFVDTRFSGDSEYMFRIERWHELTAKERGLYAHRSILYTAYQTGSNLYFKYPHGGRDRLQFVSRVRSRLRRCESVDDLYVAA